MGTGRAEQIPRTATLKPDAHQVSGPESLTGQSALTGRDGAPKRNEIGPCEPSFCSARGNPPQDRGRSMCRGPLPPVDDPTWLKLLIFSAAST